MLRFPVNSLAAPLEAFLREVRQSPGQSLRMPIKLDLGGGLGGAVQAVQVIATWAKLHDSGRPLTLSSSFASSEATRTRFASTVPGMAALYFAGSIDCEGTPLDRYSALEAVAPRVDAMQREEFQDTLRGVGTALCCFMGARNEYLKPLYEFPAPGRVREDGDFRLLLPRILSGLSGGKMAKLNEGQLDYLSALVYQLFLNADQHGAYDVSGARYSPGVRGITARLTVLDDVTSLIRYAGDDRALRVYLARLGARRTLDPADGVGNAPLPGGPMHIVEISVFDTGPGLGLRWLSGEIGAQSYGDFSEEEELDAVHTCFAKHTTTKASQYFGQGLMVALMALKRLNAFMTLRTGRLSLYQDFSHGVTDEFNPKKRFGKRRVSEIAGTGYTICFRVK